MTVPAGALAPAAPPAPPYHLHVGDALDAYATWPAPETIISDGAYGLRLFPGDPPTPDDLGAWYEPHVAAWAKYATPATTLWFWNSEVGWANVHPTLVKHGWEYETAHVWDKGIAHIAGNVNGKKIRRFPVVTELCVMYSRALRLPIGGGETLPVQEWLRQEWKRTGLPMRETNKACGVIDAATRKYFTTCHLFYLPPPEMAVRLYEYANRHGKPTDRPYFSLNDAGTQPVTEIAWERLRYRWNHKHGLTNVWTTPALHGKERVKKTASGQSLHANQKPLALMRRIIEACTTEDDPVWEPFGGLASGSVAAVELGRRAYVAEPQTDIAQVALHRLKDAHARSFTVRHDLFNPPDE